MGKYLRVGHTENRIEDFFMLFIFYFEPSREMKINISLKYAIFPIFNSTFFFIISKRQFLCLLKESEKHTRREEKRRWWEFGCVSSPLFFCVPQMKIAKKTEWIVFCCLHYKRWKSMFLVRLFFNLRSLLK